MSHLRGFSKEEIANYTRHEFQIQCTLSHGGPGYYFGEFCNEPNLPKLLLIPGSLLFLAFRE